MRIAFIGKFNRLDNEEYIARAFESLGHVVLRLPEEISFRSMFEQFDEWKPDICIFTKYEPAEGGTLFYRELKSRGIKSVCWVFDLYFGYMREYRVGTADHFRADVVVTTDGGSDEKWKRYNINHVCVRQGIHKPECMLLPPEDKDHDVVFVGSYNPANKARNESLQHIQNKIPNFTWYGKRDTNEVRGMDLNKLYARSKIVVGDSVYSSRYWSNRVVETLGRGGFLIHVDVPGIKEEYPDLVTYVAADYRDLMAKIDYYIDHPEERQEIIKRNFEHVHKNYTMDKKCAELLNKI